MTQYWTPHCEDGIKPLVGMSFTTLEAATEFYKNYAAKVGFDTRSSSTIKSRDGMIVTKHIVCSREGFKSSAAQHSNSKLNTDAGEGFSIPKRRRVSKRTGCRAKIVFKYKGSLGYEVKTFEEKHNHSMSSALRKQLLKGNRNISATHQKFIADCAKVNIGPKKCYNLYKEIVGDYYEIGTTNVDFKNMRRDMRAFILGADAQLIVHNLLKKQELCPAFSFDYDINEDEQLCRIFWANTVSKKNFATFGDVVSFDATYSTNMYNIVFTPFTGVDNHKKCVTFGVGLLLKEDIESYVWLFENFKKAMGFEPRVIVTDQDPAMKVAIPRVFQQTRHRYCIWHVMCKVGENVGPTLNKNEAFRNKLNSIMWTSYLEPVDFETQWKPLMEEFDLVDHNWFKHMFEAEICASYFSCRVLSVREDARLLHYEIKDVANRTFSVVHNVSEQEATRSCKMFEMIGLLCRHILVVFKDLNLEKIPLRYVVNRWTKDASLKSTYEIDGVICHQSGTNDEKKVLLNKLWGDIHYCISLAESSMDKLAAFSCVIDE